MVDYDTAAAVVQDPQADPIMLAKIAYENPEFGANVAVNPRAYPGLKRWLAQFGDDRCRQTLAQMGIVDQAGPVVDQPGPARQGQQAEQVQQTPAAQTAQTAAAYPQAASPSLQAQSPQATPIQATAFQAAPGQAATQSAQPDQVQAAQPVHGHSAQPQPAGQVEASNAYHFTAEQALDPKTDQMILAQIAQYAPELRPCLARNPNTYPSLLNWLAQQHDPAIDAALATRPQ
ncbi:hypothetical protein CRD60_07925 [Bifidobacterium aemilianum]|uniref:Leucine rich repeat variant domain-containing protein n=1 Tax=Bifidobacterium aemilianum TaxID=2493120 RepID=A0A366K654_9BIFI|nr:hypothetical protein [Bifidobacterium aemilianum]RBP97220.1 hypothetical protein CRD60_07925 [Bifidobacterium aemilianum]